MRITDPERFDRLLKRVHAEHGTQEATAKALKLSQAHLSRLLNANRKNPPHHLTRKTALSLARALRSKPRLYREFWRYVILGRKATRVYEREYTPWLRKTVRPFTDGRGAFTADGLAGRCNRMLQQLGHRPRRGRPGEFEYSEPYGSYFVSFDKATAGHDEPRRCFARWRAVAPLLASEDSGGIERGWDELKAGGELGPYLKAALKREEILLNRQPDLERAQAVTDATSS